jgi:5,10-methenyltetrahydrofolate synthetase
MDKKALRSSLVARRDALSPGECDQIARAFVDKLAALPEYRAARSVLATMSIGSEWSTRGFLARAQADGKALVLPRISAPPRHLQLFVVRDLDRDLKPGIWNIPEPNPAHCAPIEFADVDFALVPALAADRAGYRLGYGAGYFDRLLAGRKAAPYCVTALPAAFVLAQLPREPHDVPVDRVIDDSNIP